MTSIFSRKSLTLVALAVAAACSKSEHSAPAPTVDAAIEVVHSAAVPQLRIVSGTVRSATVSPLSAKLMGNVTRVLVTEGDHVRAGQPLLEIDNRDIRAKADQAQAGGREVEQAIDGATAAVAAAEANAAFANATYKRFAALRERGSVSPQEFEEVAAKRAGADAQLEQAKRGHDALLARRSGAKAAVSEAETYLAYSVVRSPFDGIVTARFIDPGAQAAPGMPLLIVEDASHYRVEATLDEDLAQTVRAGDAVVVDSGSRRIDARITNLVPSLDPSTRSALVKIDLPPGSGLRSGAFVKVGFKTGTRNAISVPPAAVAQRDGISSIFVIDGDGIARMRLVTLGDTAGDRIEVLSGLDDGERIVPRITNEIRDGVRITSARAANGRAVKPGEHV